MLKTSRISLGVVCALILFSGGAFAKSMQSRLGVGYRDAFPFSLPAIAVQYYPNAGMSFGGAFGIDTEDLNSKLGIQGSVRKRIFEEEQLNFFMGGSFSLLTQETAGNKKSGYELSAVLATEFFLTGLENLGFNLETGIAASNLDKVRFRTLGESFLRGGIFFYF